MDFLVVPCAVNKHVIVLWKHEVFVMEWWLLPVLSATYAVTVDQLKSQLPIVMGGCWDDCTLLRSGETTTIACSITPLPP